MPIMAASKSKSSVRMNRMNSRLTVPARSLRRRLRSAFCMECRRSSSWFNLPPPDSRSQWSRSKTSLAFIPIDVLKRNLDGMAAVKMNVLHWHLSDDQGFRVESKKLPKLHEMGSEGLYYTQAEIREFIAYAHDRGIRVIPEFDTPGHSRSWFFGYPELASNPGPFTFEPGGAESVTDPTREETYKFLDKFIDEMGKLFPDAYFHIGGDEVDGKSWDSNPKTQAFKQAHGMKSNQDLQAYFNQRLQKIVARHHKVMIGWDEILHPDLPKTIVVQSWRG